MISNSDFHLPQRTFEWFITRFDQIKLIIIKLNFISNLTRSEFNFVFIILKVCTIAIVNLTVLNQILKHIEPNLTNYVLNLVQKPD